MGMFLVRLVNIVSFKDGKTMASFARKLDGIILLSEI